MTRLLLASSSAHKVEELRRIALALVESGKVKIVSLADMDRDAPEVIEDAPDFAGNAEKKAREMQAIFGGWVLADDSGLCVNHLDDAPGVHSARYSGVGGAGRDEANNRKLLEALDGLDDERRGAAFVCALCLVSPDGEIWRTEGRCEGRITDAPRGEAGFGYDPLFVSHEEGMDRQLTHAEISPAEKDAISHRGKALRALLPILEEVL